MVIHEVGEKIFEIYDKEGKDIETYTRFNIYDLGKVVLDDHRSSESFFSKYRCDNLPKIENSKKENKEPVKEKVEELER